MAAVKMTVVEYTSGVITRVDVYTHTDTHTQVTYLL